MSKILRRSLSLVLVFMLLASLSVNGALDASADNKTGDGLAAYAMTAYNEGWKYVWGGASYGAVDCSGLIYSYVGGGARVTEDQLYSSPESGYVSDGVPDIPGLGLWQPGHVGVYVGGGMAVDARDEISNVCYQSVSTKSWVMWFKVAGVSYGTDTGVTNDDQSDKNADSEKTVESKPEEKSVDTTLRLGSTGKDVNRLQERLKELGYFEDDTTEYFGYVTKGALEDFQRTAGLSVTGVYDEDTRLVLLAGSAPSKPAPVVESDSEEPETIRFDTEEAEEVEVQPEKPILTVTAPKPEQDTESEEPDTDTTEEEQQSEPEADETQTEETDVMEEEVDSEQSSANGEEDTESTGEGADTVFETGDEDAEISDIQYILIKLGYFDYNITGTFCENTADAVENFRCDYELGDERSLDQNSIDVLYSVYNGTYGSQTAAKAPLYESIAADSEEDVSEETVGTDSSKEQSVTINAETAAQSEKESEKVSDSDTDKPAQSAAETKTAAVSAPAAPKSSESVTFVQTGVEDYFNRTLVLIVIGISCILIFFLGTIHYWNVSMEKRRQRARRASTVSVYRRSSM